MPDRAFQVLLLEDDVAHATAARRALEDGELPCVLRVVSDRESFLRQLESSPPDVVLLDLNIPGGRSLDLLPMLQAPRSYPVLILTSHGDELAAVEAIKNGAMDYLVKSPEAFAGLPRSIARALREWRLIQEHRQAQEQLQVTLEKYRVLFDMFPLGVAITDSQGKIVEMNQEGRRLLDEASEEPSPLDPLPRSPLGRMVRPNGTPLPREEHASFRALKERRPVHAEQRWVVRDDTPARWLDVTAAPIPLEGYGVAVAFGDITPRKEVERALEESRQLFESVTHTSPALLWISGPDKKCTWFNDPWLAFTGRTLAQEVGDGWAEGVHPDDLERCVATYSEAFDARKPFAMEYRLRRHDGVFRWILDQGHPRFDPSGTFLGYIGSLLDITAQKEVEQNLRQALEDRDVLLREVHHRVKNNLQVICSLISLKIDGAPSPATQDALRETLTRIRSMSLIHEHLYRRGTFAAISMATYVTELAHHLQEIFAPPSGEVDLAVAIAPELRLSLDQAISCGLLLNELVTNALKHAFPTAAPREDAPRIRVALELREHTFLLTVQDNGVGIGEDLMETDRRTLGLRLVQALVRQLEGTLHFAPGPGCQITVEFPVGA